MAEFSLELRGAQDAYNRVLRVEGVLKGERPVMMRELGRRLVGIMREAAPERTGKLKEGIAYHITHEDANSTEMVVASEAFYTKWILRGRGPVYAQRARALRFEPGPPGSGFIYRKSVGRAPANPFHVRAIKRATDELKWLERYMSERVQRAYSG